MNSYEERQAKKLAYYKEKAVKFSKESASTYNQAKQMSSMIPFGQPILIGHHSERGDRNYRNRISNKFDK